MAIVGKVIGKHSKLFGMPIENYYYISVCMKIGSSFVDPHANECRDPYWTIVDVNDKNKSMGQKTNKFRVAKNGIVFTFCRGTP